MFTSREQVSTDAASLVGRILRCEPTLRTEPHVIRLVFERIENDLEHLTHYRLIVAQSSTARVNQEIGRLVARLVGRGAFRRRNEKSLKLITSYTQLGAPRPTDASMEFVSNEVGRYLASNAQNLPPEIHDRRGYIEELSNYMELSVEQATNLIAGDITNGTREYM